LKINLKNSIITMESKIAQLPIKDLFGNNEYFIPIYQRNYAWGEKEIVQLIQDIVDSLEKDSSANYYLGSLIIDEREIDGKFETIDGQQRLTTLFIILCALKNEVFKHGDFKWFIFNLNFSSRKNSTETLKAIYESERLDNDYNSEIKEAYEISTKSIKKILNEVNLSSEKFYKYFLEKVVILRIPVPPDTDLNHYFEIMNNRGEQLEKHEILKAQCLKVFEYDNDASYTFNLIWEACANMEKYVQYGFSVSQRNAIFGENEWNTFPIKYFEELQKIISETYQKVECHQNDSISLKSLIYIDNKNQTSPKVSIEKDEDSQDRFNTVINFSNFLLHVLRLQTGKDIALDDKRLIELFEHNIKSENQIDFVKKFGFNLLKTKFLFDKYIIKREFIKGGDNWSLKNISCYKSDKGYKGNYINTFVVEAENKNLIMLLSMFHVSSPTLVYKYWLNAALKFVFENETIEPKEFVKYLENLGESYLKNHFLATNRLDYYCIISLNKGNCIENEVNETLLDNGTEVENFVFNYLDYLLWKKESPNFKDFEFTFRSSVEHYYPQNPIEGNPKLGVPVLNNFGNLCLIPRNKNSKLSNYMPNAKKEHYNNSTTVDSIKQRIMMQKDSWGENEIKEHGAEMKEILLQTETQTNRFI